MARYRNNGSMPLNYGDRGPWVEPDGEFNTEDYPEFPVDQLRSHLQSGFVCVVVTDETQAAPTPEALGTLAKRSRRRVADANE